jgi:hypothetical protein
MAGRDVNSRVWLMKKPTVVPVGSAGGGREGRDGSLWSCSLEL